jgi:hypothetical protein
MKRYSDKKIEKLKRFRKKGYSILQLVDEFQMPKTTIWHHIHNIKLPEDIIEKIKSRQGGSKVRARKQWSKAKRVAQKVIKPIDLEKNAPIILALLYWAEGNKRGFIFTNTDGEMIKVFLKILRESFGVKNEDISAMIRINNFQDKNKCINHWRKVTKIPIKNIGVDLNPKQNKSKLEYGILRIRVKKGGYLLKLVNSLNKELTSELLSSILRTKSPLVAQLD